MKVHVEPCKEYDAAAIDAALERCAAVFDSTIRKGDRVVLKPNWIAQSHKYEPDVWECVITHPALITGVLRRVLHALDGEGRVVITDGPQTDTSWDALMRRMEPEKWIRMGHEAGIEVSIVDLREDAWETRGDVNVKRMKLPGDPAGSTVCDLGAQSEFDGHQPTQKGYYGADYDTAETNEAHSNGHHRYRVSRTVIDSDVLVNIPKLKTHKKAGITCSLKNLVGINTYKNWLPHHNEGTPAQGGDQFPCDTKKSRLEATLSRGFKSILLKMPWLGRAFIPLKAIGKEGLRRNHGDDSKRQLARQRHALADGSRPEQDPLLRRG